MITEQLINPKSIVVIGGSNEIQKPGGKVLKNLIDGNFQGNLYVLNPKEDSVQGIKSFRDPADLPDTDLAIIAIAAKYTPDIVDFLAQNKKTRAFIVLSAGFSEENAEGKILEDKMVESVNKVNGSLIGPNCVGVLTPHYQGVFTLPVPTLTPKGCDFISGSGATAVFIMEAGIPKGLSFNNVYSVGNSAQMGVEEILKHMDENFDPEKDSKVKLLYLEKINKPQMLLKHASSLIRKGCRIAAVKAGASEAGSRAASSHTGALASSDVAVDALFKKAGVVRCYGREDLISVASVFMYPPFQGKNIAIITHAGGPAVMLTDKLSQGGLSVPALSGKDADALKEKLFPGSSVANPIDFLATGTAEQLGIIIDSVNEKFSEIDAMVVIFGTPGLSKIFDVYDLLDEKMKTSKKPIFPVLPSGLTAREETQAFAKKGRVYFPDEVTLGEALGKIYNTPAPAQERPELPAMDKDRIRKIINENGSGYISPEDVSAILDAAEISRAKEFTTDQVSEITVLAEKTGFPLVMKVVGPVHKSDVGGVSLNINDNERLVSEMKRMMTIPDAKGVLIQPMLQGTEMFAGVKKEENFGHMILFGLGGIFIEVLKDVRTTLAPLSREEIVSEIKQLKSYKLIQGVRGKEGLDEDAFIEIIQRLSELVILAPEIIEMDLNPLLATPNQVIAVDARIRLEKTETH
ncbi:MAG: acetate--CoA ligase family protein [Bacteroidales bacterium]|nr:acetate--CoA ligase family protein [Bacteroidales bacterium]